MKGFFLNQNVGFTGEIEHVLDTSVASIYHMKVLLQHKPLLWNTLSFFHVCSICSK